MCSSTAESAPNEDTTATSSLSTSVTAWRNTPTASISSNSPSSARICSCRCGSGSCGFKATLACAIEGLLERRLADPAIGGDERLLRALPFGDIEVDQLFDGVRHVVGNEPVAQDIADGRVLRA